MKSAIFTFIAIFVLFLSSMSSYAGTDKVVSLSVDGMFSDACPVLLKSAVRKIKGVKNVEANLENKSARIEFDEAQTTLENIQATIKSAVGFNTEIK